ncbi:MAG: hypothetical protein WD118_10955 [Phycisphaeraceae bacterium]
MTQHPSNQTASRGCVLVGFGEALAAPESVWSLIDAGFTVHAFVRHGRPPVLRHCRGVQVTAITSPEVDAGQCVDDLVALRERIDPVAIFPMDDTAVWVCDAAHARLVCPVVGPTGEQAALALDKRRQMAAAEAAGFAVPTTRSADDAAALDEPVRYPVVIKPALAMACRDGRLMRGRHHVCANAAEWQRAVASSRGEGPVMVQPFVRGVGEGVFGLATPAGVLAFSGHRRVRMMNPAGSGSSACQSQPVDEATRQCVQRLMTASGWQGLFMVELLCDDTGQRWFMELNGRPWGSMALARRMGLEYPAWAARLALDIDDRPEVSEPQDAAEPVLCRHLGRELVHLLAVLRGPRSTALTQWPSRWATLRALLRVRRTDAWYNSRPGERRVLFADAWQTVYSQVRKPAKG